MLSCLLSFLAGGREEREFTTGASECEEKKSKGKKMLLYANSPTHIENLVAQIHNYPPPLAPAKNTAHLAPIYPLSCRNSLSNIPYILKNYTCPSLVQFNPLIGWARAIRLLGLLKSKTFFFFFFLPPVLYYLPGCSSILHSLIFPYLPQEARRLGFYRTLLFFSFFPSLKKKKSSCSTT